MHALYSQLTILLRIRRCHQEHEKKGRCHQGVIKNMKVSSRTWEKRKQKRV